MVEHSLIVTFIYRKNLSISNTRIKKRDDTLIYLFFGESITFEKRDFCYSSALDRTNGQDKMACNSSF